MLAAALFSLAIAAVPALAGCDVSKATLTLPAGQTTLVEPTAPTSFIAVAIGVQNYTCDSTGHFTNVGAVAELFDISCLWGTSGFDSIQDTAYGIWEVLPPIFTPQTVISILHSSDAPAILGQHYYVPNPITGSGVNPKWDFTSQGALAGNPNAFVVASKVAGLAAPTGSQDIDWVNLKQLTGDLASQVYRVDTKGGQPPTATCVTGSNPISVKYAAKYWLFGGSIA